MGITIKVNMGGLPAYSRAIKQDLANQENGPVRQALRKWAARYRTFALVRFTQFSRGGGDWKALKPATILRKKSSGILMDTGTLRAALRPSFDNLPGQLEKHGPNSVTVGYGPGGHPKARMVIEELAEIHQEGKGNNPERKLIVPPDRQTRLGMIEDMGNALKQLGAQHDVS